MNYRYSLLRANDILLPLVDTVPHWRRPEITLVLGSDDPLWDDLADGERIERTLYAYEDGEISVIEAFQHGLLHVQRTRQATPEELADKSSVKAMPFRQYGTMEVR